MNGLIAKTEADWADKLERLVSDASLRASMGEAAFRSVSVEYSPENLAPEVDAVFEEIAGLARLEANAPPRVSSS